MIQFNFTFNRGFGESDEITDSAIHDPLANITKHTTSIFALACLYVSVGYNVAGASMHAIRRQAQALR